MARGGGRWREVEGRKESRREGGVRWRKIIGRVPEREGAKENGGSGVDGLDDLVGDIVHLSRLSRRTTEEPRGDEMKKRRERKEKEKE